jgi:hypothetical protein
MAILVTTLCERVDNHGGRRRPRPLCGPTPGGTLQSETILRNKLMSLNLEKNIVIYTIMTIKGTTRRS